MLLYSNITLLSKNFNNLINKKHEDPATKKKYYDYAIKFANMVKTMPDITIFREELDPKISEGSYYIGLEFNTMDLNNPNRQQVFRFSNHTRNFGNVKLMMRNTFSVSPDEHTYEEALDYFNYCLKLAKNENIDFKLYSIIIRRQKRKYYDKRSIRTTKELYYYVFITTNTHYYYGESDKGATSAINNAVDVISKELIDNELKSVILMDLNEKIKEMDRSKYDARISALVKIPDNNINQNQLLANILRIINDAKNKKH